MKEPCMRCPYCRVDETRVVDSRDGDEGSSVRRRRECASCGRRFTTYERFEEPPLVVLKRDGSREPFDRAKVLSGISKACKNLPVSDAEMLAVTDGVEEAVRAAGSEVPSRDVGLEVLSRLEALDKVAYVRFASVYRHFRDIGEFMSELKDLLNAKE